MRATLHELGEHRATGFLKKFYGWYLVLGASRSRSSRSSYSWRRSRRSRQCFWPLPARPRFSPASRGELPAEEDVLLDLPISAYGGG